MEARPNAGRGDTPGPAANEHARTQRTRLIVIAAVVVAAALVLGSYLTTQRRQPVAAKNPASTSAPIAEKLGDPNQVAQPGQALARVTEPPTQTRVMISLPPGTPEAAFKVEFEPYGLGPGGALVVKVTKADSSDGSEEAARLAKKLTGSNLLVRPSGGVESSQMKGGAYVGTIKTVAEKDAYAFVLTEAEAR